MGPLSGVRVLEFGDVAAAFAGRLLADLGADVVRLEPPEGDSLRRTGPFLRDGHRDERSLVHHYYCANKHAARLPVGFLGESMPFGDADILLLGGGREELFGAGWDPQRIRRDFPHLVVCCVTPFGLSGPHASWRVCDTVAQAAGGMLLLNGHPDRPPVRSPGPQALHMAGLHAVIGAILALLARARTGRGQLVEVAVQEAVIATVEHATALWWQRGTIEHRRGTLHWTGGFRAARCRDGWILYSHLGDWTTLAEWVACETGDREILREEWHDIAYRQRNAERLFAILERWGRNHNAEELAHQAQLRRLPFAPLRHLADVAKDTCTSGPWLFPVLGAGRFLGGLWAQ